MSEVEWGMRPASVARRMGLTIKTLRYYEKRGLLRPRRTAKGWRVYDEAEVEKLAQIAAFKAMGFDLSQIAVLLDAGPDAVAAALVQQELDLGAQIEDLRRAIERVREAREDAANMCGADQQEGRTPCRMNRTIRTARSRGGHSARYRRPALHRARPDRRAA